MSKVRLSEQIAEVKRELEMRAHVYPGLVSKGKMRQAEAGYRTTAMEAVLGTLVFLQRHEDTFREIAEAEIRERRPQNGVD